MNNSYWLRQHLLYDMLKAGGETAFNALLLKIQEVWRGAGGVTLRRMLTRIQRLLQSAGSIAEAEGVLAKIDWPDLVREGLPQDRMQELQELAYIAGAQAATVRFSLQLVDQRALSILHDQNLFWIGEHYEELGDSVNAVVRQAIQEGWSRKPLAEALEEKFGALRDPEGTYWEAFADHLARKTRELGRVAGYERAGIQYVKVRAILDERTTPMCRSMHGRIIPVSRLTTQRDEILRATGTDRLKNAQAWLPKFERATSELPHNVAMPPYHYRCRTVTVAYLEETTETGRGYQFYDGEGRRKETVVAAQVDKVLGRELILTESGVRNTGLSAERLDEALQSVQNFRFTPEGFLQTTSAGGLILEYRDNVVWRRLS